MWNRKSKKEVERDELNLKLRPKTLDHLINVLKENPSVEDVHLTVDSLVWILTLIKNEINDKQERESS